jgi:hypothetical protein
MCSGLIILPWMLSKNFLTSPKLSMTLGVSFGPLRMNSLRARLCCTWNDFLPVTGLIQTNGSYGCISIRLIAYVPRLTIPFSANPCFLPHAPLPLRLAVPCPRLRRLGHLEHHGSP